MVNTITVNATPGSCGQYTPATTGARLNPISMTTAPLTTGGSTRRTTCPPTTCTTMPTTARVTPATRIAPVTDAVLPPAARIATTAPTKLAGVPRGSGLSIPTGFQPKVMRALPTPGVSGWNCPRSGHKEPVDRGTDHLAAPDGSDGEFARPRRVRAGPGAVDRRDPGGEGQRVDQAGHGQGVQPPAVERVAGADGVHQRRRRDRHPDVLAAQGGERALAAQADNGQRDPAGVQVHRRLLRGPAGPEQVQVFAGQPDDVGQRGPPVDRQPVRRHRHQQR